MSSFTRMMQRRNQRAEHTPTARRLRGQVRGQKLGTTNDKAPAPNSLPARGSRRSQYQKKTWRSEAS